MTFDDDGSTCVCGFLFVLFVSPPKTAGLLLRCWYNDRCWTKKRLQIFKENSKKKLINHASTRSKKRAGLNEMVVYMRCANISLSVRIHRNEQCCWYASLSSSVWCVVVRSWLVGMINICFLCFFLLCFCLFPYRLFSPYSTRSLSRGSSHTYRGQQCG